MSMQPERKTALTYSAGMHVALILFAIFGLPVLFEMNRDPEPMAISVDILPISAISNVKPSQNKPTPDKEKPQEQEKPEEKPKPQPEQDKPKPKPTPPVKQEKTLDEILKVSDTAEIKKKVEDKQDKKKKVDEDFDAVLKSLDKSSNEKTSEKSEKTDKKTSSDTQSKSDKYDESMPLSISEKDMIRSQFIKCWNMPAGSKDAENLISVISVNLAEDGTVLSAEIKKTAGNSDSARSAAESAKRAVYKCSPLKNLPSGKYGSWKEMELTFDPREMLY